MLFGNWWHHTLKMIDLELRRVRHRTDTDRENWPDETNKAATQQDFLTFVGLSLLLNLAENTTVERKMVKKGLIHILLSFLN